MSLQPADAVIVKGTPPVRKHHLIESGEKKRLRIPDSIHKTLECPVCTDIMCPPIHQCLDGHTLCSTCKDTVQNRCPICSQELGKVRCLALEQVAASFEFPCRYQDLGCHDILTYDKKLGHEKICDFRPYNCPDTQTSCSVTGDAHFLVSHLKNKHSADVIKNHIFSQTYELDSDVGQAAWTITVVSCFDTHFCLHFVACVLEGARVYMSFVQFMGNDEEAKKFKYSLAVLGRDDRMLEWKGVPWSIRHHRIKVKNSQDGLMIPRRLAHFFAGGDEKNLNLTVIGRIRKRNL